MKLWARVKINEKLVHNELLENDLADNRYNYEQSLREICEKMDISTPVSLSSHYKHFHKFNIVKYNQQDFIDKENFDILEIENCPN